jgi:hypothetical protein
MPENDEQITTQKESVVLSGADLLLNGEPHIGIAVAVTSGTGRSVLMIPDVGGVADGKPVYITKPIGIKGKKLAAFLCDKQPAIPAKGNKPAVPEREARCELPPKVKSLIADTTISCEAFYYSKDVMLMMFALTFETGLISALTETPGLDDLFDIESVTVRVIKCPKDSFKVLEAYAAGLSAESA